MTMPGDVDSDRVLVLTPAPRDEALTIELLARILVPATACASVRQLSDLRESSAMALVVEEVLTPAAIEELSRDLARQPPWSDFPIVVVCAARALTSADDPRWAALGNVTLVERPLRVPTMLAAVRAGLRARRRQYEARRAIESRDQFLAMLGHELRNPLSAIRLASELLARSENDAAALQRHREIIERQARHLSRLVDDLLDVARVTYGKVTLHLEPLDLGEVLRTCAASLEHAFRAAGINLRTSVRRDAHVRGDRVRIEQVMSNLLTNAIKYTPRGGWVHASVFARDGSAVLKLRDSGIGLEPGMTDRVFELFAQVDRSLERSQGGMGIGLTLVRSLVALHGGRVRASSEGLGRGAEFTVELPLADAGVAADPSAPHLTESTTMRIVVVEDVEDSRNMFRELLELDGHKVWTANDGPGGVATILDAKPDVAFVDIGLPGFDGYEVARRVRATGTSARLIALTGYGQSEDRRLASEAGFDDHITKPVDFDRIHSTLASLEQSRAAPSR